MQQGIRQSDCSRHLPMHSQDERSEVVHTDAILQTRIFGQGKIFPGRKGSEKANFMNKTCYGLTGKNGSTGNPVLLITSGLALSV